jgi:LysM repeat protein
MTGAKPYPFIGIQIKKELRGETVLEVYIVQFGDTLISIATKKLGNVQRWSEIAGLNNLSKPYTLFVGQRLKLSNLN